MQFLFKVIILFLIVFNFRVPVFYNSAFVSIILSAVYYIWKRGSIPFRYFFQRYNAIILVGTIALALVIALIALLHGTDIIGLNQKRLWIVFMMLWATIFAIPLLVEGKEDSALEEIALIICSVFALQGVISLIAYLYSPLANLLMDMRPQEVIDADQEDTLDNRFRYLNLSGTVLVELTAAFGAAFIVFFWMQLRYNHPYMSGWKKYIFLIFIFLGTVFSGRTGFFGLMFGLGGWLLFSFSRFLRFLKRNIVYITAFSAIIIFVYYFVFSSSQRQSINNEVFPFAFEWYYNYRDYGKFEVRSMEATTVHYYYLSDETLLKGHGMLAFGGNSPYPHSDAGYTNNLVFGGIPFLICLIIYQFLYIARPIAITLKNNSRENKIDRMFFFILFLYIFFVEIKAPAIGYMHLVEVMYLALGSAYVMNYYLQREKNKLTG